NLSCSCIPLHIYSPDSNVFDHAKGMNLSVTGAEDSQMRGIADTPDVGYLSAHEAVRYLKVGDFLKNPRFPIWVVGSESHYTVLFALDPRVGVRSEREKKEAE